MNYMPKVLEMLGVEVGEKFNIKNSAFNPHHFDEDYCITDKDRDKVNGIYYIVTLLNGKDEIEKLPWKPKEDDEYYIVCENENIVKCRWSSRNTNSFYRYNAGNCFKTKEEITPEIKQRILQEMKGKYEND